MVCKKMLFSITAGICILFLAGCNLPFLARSGPIGPCGNPLLPTAAGATWHYDMTGTTTDTFTRSIQAADSSGFTDQDLFHDSGATRSGKWTCSSGNLTSLDLVGELTATASRPSNLLPALAFQTTDSSGVTLPARINAGDSWTQTTSLDGTAVVNLKNVDATSDVSVNCTAAGTESVTVPAGTFDAMRLDCQIDQLITVTVGEGQAAPAHINYTTTYWYARNVGLVRSVTNGANLDTTISLASYTIP